jgi:hypothetical protein
VKHTRASVIKRADTEYRALDKIVRQLEAADFRKPAMREEAPIRFTAKDVLAHITAWKANQSRAMVKDKSPRRPFEPPRSGKPSNINTTNAGIYRRSHRTPLTTIVAEHRAAQRLMLKALRGAPADYFAKRRSEQWPFDGVGHVAEHRRKHLEPLLAAKTAARARPTR